MGHSIIPTLRYRDASGAIEWLRDAFGFEALLLVPGENDTVAHSRLTRGDVMIMITSLGRDGEAAERYGCPEELGAITQSLALHVDDVDAIHDQAKSHGARIVDEPHDSPFGGRLFSCKDPEGHLWTFLDHDVWQV